MNFIPACYQACYRDKNGNINTTLYNDGTKLTITLQGVTFQSNFFDDFELSGSYSEKQLEHSKLMGLMNSQTLHLPQPFPLRSFMRILKKKLC